MDSIRSRSNRLLSRSCLIHCSVRSRGSDARATSVSVCRAVSVFQPTNGFPRPNIIRATFSNGRSQTRNEAGRGGDAGLRLPPNRQIMLPQPYISARQALELIVPFMARFKPHWGLTMLSAYGFRLPDGRGIWQARWRYGDSEDMVEVVLLEDGRLIFRGESSPSYAWDLLPNAIKLPERRLDSTDIAAIVARLPVPSGFAATSLGSMTLRSFKDHPHLWEILFPGDRNAVGPLSSWIVYLDPVSGEVVAELLGRRDDYEIVPARRRLKDGDWEDLGPS